MNASANDNAQTSPNDLSRPASIEMKGVERLLSHEDIDKIEEEAIEKKSYSSVIGQRIDFIEDSQISKVSDFTSKNCCFRFSIFIAMVLSFTLAATAHYLVVKWGIDNDWEADSTWKQLSFRNPLLYLLYLPSIFFIMIVIIGRYALSGVLYPYQNYIMKDTLFRQNNIKFGYQFSHYLECFIFTLKSQSGIHSPSSPGQQS